MTDQPPVGQTENQQLQEAFAAWIALLGTDRVIMDGSALELANTATFRTPQRCIAILEPGDREEVAACLRIASELRIFVYPVSAGRNWGYGSRVPTQSGSVLLSLARLNRILEYNEDLAYITVEPGVTFRHISRFLDDQNSGLLPPLIGTSPDASLIGNVLERGIGKGPYENMASRSCGYEVVLPTGEIIESGTGGLPGSEAVPLHTAGIGPSLQGLFQQSNLGVVTRMSFWLEPAPLLRQQVVFLLPTSGHLSSSIDRLRRPLLRNRQQLQVEMMNQYRYLAQTSQFPYETFDGENTLPKDKVKQILHDTVDGHWVGNATLWADSDNERNLLLDMLLSLLQPIGAKLYAADPKPGHHFPHMTDPIQSAYWRKRQPASGDLHPDRDGCGVIWIAPIVPMIGAIAVETLERIEKIIIKHGLEPAISLRFPEGRCIHVLIGLLYDREDSRMEERAIQCHRSVSDHLRQQGIVPYRLNLLNMEDGSDDLEGHNPLLTGLKHLFDPVGILSPGRYIPNKKGGAHDGK